MQEILDLREELDAAIECIENIENSGVDWDEIRESYK